MERREKYRVRTAEETAWCAEYCRQWWPEDVAHILRIAERVTRNEFLFDLPWDMEPTTEPVIFPGEIKWDYMPGNDPEFIFQFNRHRYWICLGQAYALTGEEKYVSCFVRQLRSWVISNPLNEDTRSITWRTIEAGLRAENWIKAMRYMVDSRNVDEEVLALFEDALLTHGEYLYGHDVPFSVKSNWGVIENNGLYQIGMLLGKEEYVQTALHRLYRQAAVQILPDGVHWEQSPMYHNEVLHCFLEVLHTAEVYSRRLDRCFTETVRKMAGANLAWIKPDGCQPAGGDSDRTCIRDLLTASACRFGDRYMKYAGYDRLGYEAVWELGCKAAQEYESMEKEEPVNTFFALAHSGNWYRRSGWGSEADWLHFRCGSLGGGHGHMDKLHLELAVAGEDVLVDSGRFTYVPGPDRSSYKSAAAHNTLLADGGEYSRCADAWSVTGMARPVNAYAASEGRYSLLEGGHTGYCGRGILLNRKVISVGTGLHLIVDEAFAAGVHSYMQVFHFNPAGTVETEAGNNTFLYSGKRARALFLPVEPGTQVRKSTCMISEAYNRQEPSVCIRAESRAKGFHTMATVISGVPVKTEDGRSGGNGDNTPLFFTVRKTSVTVPVTGRTLPDEAARAFILERDSESYLILVRFGETAADCEYIGAEGFYGLGQVMVCDRNRDTCFTVLKW